MSPDSLMRFISKYTPSASYTVSLTLQRFLETILCSISFPEVTMFLSLSLYLSHNTHTHIDTFLPSFLLHSYSSKCCLLLNRLLIRYCDLPSFLLSIRSGVEFVLPASVTVRDA
jgi:hypothetical protein